MLTVAELVAHPELRLRAEALPDPGLGVRWVAASELTDPTPFLEGGEVLLTTGLDTRGWRREWRPYVARLRAAGVAALGLGVGLTHRRIPAPLVSACRAEGLNLFEVPREGTFVAVSRAAAALLERDQEATARRVVDLQRRLVQAALRSDDREALLRRLADAVDGAASVHDRDGACRLGPVGPRAAALDPDVVAAEVARIRPRGNRAAASIVAGGTSIVVQPLGVGPRPEGFVAVCVPGRFGEAQRSAAATGVALLSLAEQRRVDRRTTDRRLRARALELLVGADPHAARIVLAARTGGGPGEVTLPARIRLLRAVGDHDALEDALQGVEPRELAAVVGDELWVVTLETRADRVGGRLVDAGLRVGVGSPGPVEDAAASHRAAGEALASTSAGVPLVRWDDVVATGAAALVDPDRAAAFARSFLAPLAGDAELLTTLGVFVNVHGSRLKVAEELGVHRNTVRNRLAAIEAALGRSLDDPQVRFSAWLALQAA